MIRVFEFFRKFNLKNISAKDLFLKFMAEFNPYEHKCPLCGTKHPDWEKHATYERYLISFENGHIITYEITIFRYRCPSCKHTHAILPECLIPYRSYSFLFILAVMRDYFASSLTVVDICNKYDISVSTLYSWKKLFLKHKKIWLGLLNDAIMSSLQFLDSFFTEGIQYALKDFFLIAAISFMQGPYLMKKAYSVPP
jgi:hypothetical protein